MVNRRSTSIRTHPRHDPPVEYTATTVDDWHVDVYRNGAHIFRGQLPVGSARKSDDGLRGYLKGFVDGFIGMRR